MSLGTKPLYEFGKFRCDPQEHQLLREGNPVYLSPKSFEILVVFLQSNGRLLTKDELMRQVWPDSFVEEANLTVNISALRKALGDSPDGERYIQTVPKSGYRFLMPVREVHPSAPTFEPAQATSATGASVPKFRFRSWWPGLIILLAAAVVGAALLVSFRRPKLSDKDMVVLADFMNTTGDPAFDGALRQGLSSQLEQSPYLNLLSDERIAHTLSLMAQPKDTRLSHALAHEVCLRTGSTAVLDPSIAQVGTQYLLTVKVLSCSNDDSLGSAEEQAADKNHVLDAMGKVAARIRNQLGESLASVQRYDAPPENVTTPSLEALKSYSLGYQALALKADYTAAAALFQRAIDLDPNFAMAYARMGTSLFNVYETVRAADYARKAFELRERVSERERFYIASHYALIVTGNLESARKIYELSAQTYPRDIPLNNLGVIYSELGDFDEALRAYQKVLQVSSATGNRYANLVNGYIQLNRLDDAKATVREAKSRNIDSPELHLSLYWIAFQDRDAARMEAEASELIANPGHADRMLNYQADTALYFGQLSKSRGLTNRAIEAAQKSEHKEAAALYKAESAIRESLIGNMSIARKGAQSALSQSSSRDVVAISAIALKIAGDSAGANRLMADLEKRYPEDSLVQNTYLPALRTILTPKSRDEVRTAHTMNAQTRFEFGGNLETVNFVFYPVYLKGLSYLEANDGAAAEIEFRKILDHPGALRSEPIGALARLQLARSLRLSGQNDPARSAYKEFLTLWKDADTDIPILKEARTEYSVSGDPGTLGSVLHETAKN